MTTLDQPLDGLPARPHGGTGAVLVAAAVLGLWFTAILAANLAGAFEPDPTRPPLALAAALALPVIILVAAYRLSARVRTFALGLDLGLLTTIQSWRVLGGMFLVLYAYGMLSGVFAWPAGVGDVAVGIAVPFAAASLAAGAAGWQRKVLWLNIAGLLDFVGAVGTGLLTSSSALGIIDVAVRSDPMTSLPLALIPTFAVPFFIVVHVISLIQLARIKADDRAERL